MSTEMNTISLGIYFLTHKWNNSWTLHCPLKCKHCITKSKCESLSSDSGNETTQYKISGKSLPRESRQDFWVLLCDGFSLWLHALFVLLCVKYMYVWYRNHCKRYSDIGSKPFKIIVKENTTRTQGNHINTENRSANIKRITLDWQRH